MSSQSPTADDLATATLPPLTMPRLMGWAAQQYGDKLAVSDGGREVTYRALNDLRRRAGKACMACGIGKGDKVAIWAPNSLEWMVAAMGAQSVGAVLVPLNTRLHGAEAADILRRAGVVALFTVGRLEQGVPAELLADESLPDLRRTILLDAGQGEHDLLLWDAFLEMAEAADPAAYTAAERSVNPDDIADMLFTSGTTGKAKGVLCSHQQNIRVFANWSHTVGLRCDDNYLIINPFFHSFGYKAGWLAALICGSAIFPLAQFERVRLLQAIAEHRITMLPGAPSLYEMILAAPERDDYDLSSLRLGVTGAASVPVQLVRDMREQLGFDVVVTAYGLTESTGVVSICRPEDDPETIASTCGRAMPGVELCCVDPESGAVQPAGEAGEVWVRGYNVMQGYHDMPEATAATITAEGWLRTGDIGVLDERGYLRITDRLKDMYIMNGENVYPAEIEKLLYNLHGVQQAAVIGVPKAPQGEVGMAFVVRKPGAALSESDVRSYCADQLARYKQPAYVVFVDSLPMNASGKVLKTELALQAKEYLAAAKEPKA